MRIFAVLIFIGLLVACSQTALKPSSSSATTREVVIEAQASSKDQALEFLLSVSAKDFMTHMPPEPLEFRNVILGQIDNPNDATLYLMCGEFLAEEDDGTFIWVDFAAIKTNGYEQWLGTQAKGLCQQPEVVWDEQGDLSALLLARVEVYRN